MPSASMHCGSWLVGIACWTMAVKPRQCDLSFPVHQFWQLAFCGRCGLVGDAVACQHERISRSVNPDVPDPWKRDMGTSKPIPMVARIGKNSLAGVRRERLVHVKLNRGCRLRELHCRHVHEIPDHQQRRFVMQLNTSCRTSLHFAATTKFRQGRGLPLRRAKCKIPDNFLSI